MNQRTVKKGEEFVLSEVDACEFAGEVEDSFLCCFHIIRISSMVNVIVSVYVFINNRRN